MRGLPRIPEDAELCDMIRAGLNTVSAIAHKIYGYPEDKRWLNNCRTRVHEHLVSMEKYGMVRRTSVKTPYSRGQYVHIWEVIE